MECTYNLNGDILLPPIWRLADGDIELPIISAEPNEKEDDKEEPYETQVPGEIILPIVGLDGEIIYPNKKQPKETKKTGGNGDILLWEIHIKVVDNKSEIKPKMSYKDICTKIIETFK